MKPFDIVAAKNGSEVLTRSGLPARIICFDRKAADCPVVALVLSGKGTMEDIVSYTKQGRFCNETEHSEYDLFMKPVKKTYWANVYRTATGKTIGSLHDTKKEAIEGVNNDYDYFTTISFEIEE